MKVPTPKIQKPKERVLKQERRCKKSPLTKIANQKKAKKAVLFILVLMFITSDFGYGAATKYDIVIDPQLSLSNKGLCEAGSININSRRIKKGSNGKKISFQLQSNVAEAGYVPVDTGGHAYSRFTPGSNCYMHNDDTTKNSNPLVSLVLTCTSSTKCKVSHIITNSDLIPCGGEDTQDIWTILQLTEGAGDVTDFNKITMVGEYLYGKYASIMIIIREGSADMTKIADEHIELSSIYPAHT